ncbi:MAG: helix-turn-helix domain-containing protein [Candidatus Promineifilaceae bacterium]|nr:helix-turn-helix domain-containing protein [Candidatus Promineifilaceae bacterium]
MNSPATPDAEFIIRDPETLKVLGHALRLQLLKALKRPRTVKELGAALDLPPTKLYYHINLLEKHELIRVVATDVVSGIIEKQYQISARNYRVEDALLSPVEGEINHLDVLLAAMFESTQADIRRSIDAGLMRIRGGHDLENGAVVKYTLHLTAAQRALFLERLRALLDLVEEATEGDDTDPYGLTLAYYPLPDETEPQEDST